MQPSTLNNLHKCNTYKPDQPKTTRPGKNSTPPSSMANGTNHTINLSRLTCTNYATGPPTHAQIHPTHSKQEHKNTAPQEPNRIATQNPTTQTQPQPTLPHNKLQVQCTTTTARYTHQTARYPPSKLPTPAENTTKGTPELLNNPIQQTQQ